PWGNHPNLEIARIDLRARQGIAESLDGIDAVIHAAAAVGGDLYAQLASTVVATENLLDAMLQSTTRRLVLISSFSVYEYFDKAANSLLDESSAMEHRIYERDDYCLTKVLQENLARDYAARHDLALTVIRPGVIFGSAHLWTACLGAEAGPRTWIQIGASPRLPMAYVENCAEAILTCATNDAAVGETFNLVDDEAPTHAAYIGMLRSRLTPRPRVIPVPWIVMSLIAALAQWTNRVAFGGNAKLPSILVPCRLHARCKPFRYTNAHAQDVLDWQPRYTLEEALDRSFLPEVDLLAVDAHSGVYE
ncbi:MAG: NAD(P)-dependent oxidoreductase, partial [Candidatus Hydrogenedentales bacterium]